MFWKYIIPFNQKYHTIILCFVFHHLVCSINPFKSIRRKNYHLNGFIHHLSLSVLSNYRAVVLAVCIRRVDAKGACIWNGLTGDDRRLPHIAHKITSTSSWVMTRPDRSIIKCACRPLQFTVRTHIKTFANKRVDFAVSTESGYLCMNVTVISLHDDGSAHKTGKSKSHKPICVHTVIHYIHVSVNRLSEKLILPSQMIFVWDFTYIWYHVH